jgi:hypothetical protein
VFPAHDPFPSSTTRRAATPFGLRPRSFQQCSLRLCLSTPLNSQALGPPNPLLATPVSLLVDLTSISTCSPASSTSFLDNFTPSPPGRCPEPRSPTLKTHAPLALIPRQTPSYAPTFKQPHRAPITSPRLHTTPIRPRQHFYAPRTNQPTPTRTIPRLGLHSYTLSRCSRTRMR